jgi:Rad3-related DNA helicase
MTASVHPIPAQFNQIRPHQAIAVGEACDLFDDGCEVVFMDAPTGSGKTLIGELVRRLRREQGKADRVLYVCSDKALQRQFLADFPYAKVLMGRSNYKTELGGDALTAEDCTAPGMNACCMWCQTPAGCPYKAAKQEAMAAEVAVVNTSYFLAEANHVGQFSGFDLIIVDEADALEGVLMGFVEYEVPQYVWNALHLKAPVKGARRATILKWLEEVHKAADQHVARNHGRMEEKVKMRWRGFVKTTEQTLKELAKDQLPDVAEVAGVEQDGQWLRDYDTKTFKMKPVLVGRYGPKYLWRHATNWLLMSATIVSCEEMVESLGLPYDWGHVVVPMTFPVENRPVYLAPVANVTFKDMDDAVPKLAYALGQISGQHKGERVLVHTVSYGLNSRLLKELVVDRPVFSYAKAADKDRALADFLASADGMLLAPSMERGIDLKGDQCRVVVVAKVPFPALGDRRISARTHLPGGQLWYTVQTIRDIVQMTGRGVRSEDDWAVTYILDAQFSRNVWRNRSLFPRWWSEAVDSGQDLRWLHAPRAKSVVT